MHEDLDIPFPGQGAALGEPYARPGYGRRQGGMDANTKRLAIIAGGIGGALLLLVGVWSAIAPHRAGTPVIEADARPLREKPVNKGGLNIIGADESGLSSDIEGKAVVAPAPETPAIAALKATLPTPAPVVETAVAPAAVARTAAEEQPKSVAFPAVAAPKEVPSGGVQLAKPAAPAPVAVATNAAPRVGAPAAAAITAKPTAPVGGAQVQLAAVGSEEAAQAEWERLARKYPDLLGSRHLVVSHVDRGAKTFWRVRTGGFASVASATTFCNQIRTKGAVCSVASF